MSFLDPSQSILLWNLSLSSDVLRLQEHVCMRRLSRKRKWFSQQACIFVSCARVGVMTIRGPSSEVGHLHMKTKIRIECGLQFLNMSSVVVSLFLNLNLWWV